MDRYQLSRLADLQPRKQSHTRIRSSQGTSLGTIVSIGAAVLAATGIAAFCGDVGGIRTSTGQALRPYVEESNKKKYGAVNVNGTDYMLVGNDVYIIGSVTPVSGDGRISLRQRNIGSVPNWSDFDTAVKTINNGSEPKAGMPYAFPSHQVPSDTNLYQKVIAAHQDRQ